MIDQSTEVRYLRKTITDVKLLMRNFRGLPNMFLPEGKRSFVVVISDEMAQEMHAEGWVIQSGYTKKPGIPGDTVVPVLKVYLPEPFDLSTLTLNGEALKSESSLAGLDSSDIILYGTVDLHGRFSNVRERRGVKNFAVSLDVKIK